MRIASQLLYRSALRGLERNLAALARAQEEVATGRRVRTVSDDPVAASQIMRLDAHLRDIEQFQRNATAASTRLSTEDVVVTTARDLMQRARGLALSGATQSPDDPLRQAALADLRQIREQLVSLGNTRLGNEYLFGGAQTTSPPFLADGTYVGDATVRVAQIDDQVTIDTNHTGNALFQQAFQALDALETELETGTQASIQDCVGALAAAGQVLLAAQTEAGARMGAIQATSEHLARRSDDLTGQLESLRDVDPTEAVTRLLAAQTALERAYAAVGKVLSTNFLDYL